MLFPQLKELSSISTSNSARTPPIPPRCGRFMHQLTRSISLRRSEGRFNCFRVIPNRFSSRHTVDKDTLTFIPMSRNCLHSNKVTWGHMMTKSERFKASSALNVHLLHFLVRAYGLRPQTSSVSLISSLIRYTVDLDTFHSLETSRSWPLDRTIFSLMYLGYGTPLGKIRTGIWFGQVDVKNSRQCCDSNSHLACDQDKTLVALNAV